jgi:hypothetical protein
MIAHNSPTAVALPGLGAAVHASWRIRPSFAWGGMLGLGLNSKSIVNPNFYFGTSFIFGWRERFILSFGYALNHVDYLHHDHYVGQTVRKNSITSKELVEKTYRGGMFFSFTFNLTNKKKGQ